MNWLFIGAILSGLSVAVGAFGAHGLSDVLSKNLDGRAASVFQTGVQYQIFHSLGILGLALAGKLWPDLTITGPAWAFAIGILLFSGSLYALSITGIKFLGAITPLGGVAFLIGWGWFSWLVFNEVK